MQKTYQAVLNEKYIQETNQRIENMPDYVERYVYAKRSKTSGCKEHTILNYVRDISLFFYYLTQRNPICKNMNYKDISIDIIRSLTVDDLEEYASFLASYEKYDENHKKDRVFTNSERTISRKLSALRSLFEYLERKGFIDDNPALKLEKTKRKRKDIIAMDASEQNRFVEAVENKENYSGRKKELRKKTALRDDAIIYILLGTGIRVSELVGLDIADVDLVGKSFFVTRKGSRENEQQKIKFNDEVKTAIENYLYYCREELQPNKEHEHALFISLHHKRMSVRMIELLVKEYAKASGIAGSDKITPHKLRSTYGTQLLSRTGNVRLVAHALGHSDLSTVSEYTRVLSIEEAANVQIKREENRN